MKADAQRVNVASSALYARLVTKWRAASDREELLKQRFDRHLMFYRCFIRFRPNDSTAVSFEDQEHLMNDRLQSTNRQVDDLIAHGAAVLDNLRHQHMSLRGVRRKMMDIGAAVSLDDNYEFINVICLVGIVKYNAKYDRSSSSRRLVYFPCRLHCDSRFHVYFLSFLERIIVSFPV